MLEMTVRGMTCGHCEAAVTRAVRRVDPGAQVTVERASGRVAVETTAAAADLRRAVEAEGYAVAAVTP